MITTDCHLHTSFSSDSDTPMEEMIKQAILKGLSVLCFTEHYDEDFPDNPEGLDFLLDFDGYYHRFLEYRDKYKDKIKLLHGIEVGVQSHLGDALHKFYQTYGSRYDFILASCHVVDQMDPYEPEFFQVHPGKEGMALYLETQLANLDVFPDFQSLAHMDYAYRYCPSPRPEFQYSDYGDILDATLQKLISKGKALEINTSGWRSGLMWPNPHIDILKRYRELGGQLLTIGSDAHKPVDLASHFEKLPDILKTLGFQYYAVFENQEPIMIPI